MTAKHIPRSLAPKARLQTRVRATATTTLALLTLVLLPTAAHAWGQNGHRVVARIAESHLSAEARLGVTALLGPDSLPRVSTWADEIRSDPAWDEASPWHYINADVPEPDALLTVERSPEGDILEALERFELVLRDRDASREERAVALKLLVHLVADAHQPLHVGASGGDEIVLWFGEPTDLHSLWDSGLIEHQRLGYTELAAFIDHPTEGQVATWQAAGFREWLAESYGLREAVYDLGNQRLGWDYAFHKAPIVERRLLQAGVRLAGLLNRAFSEPTTDGAPPRAQRATAGSNPPAR